MFLSIKYTHIQIEILLSIENKLNRGKCDTIRSFAIQNLLESNSNELIVSHSVRNVICNLRVNKPGLQILMIENTKHNLCEEEVDIMLNCVKKQKQITQWKTKKNRRRSNKHFCKYIKDNFYHIHVFRCLVLQNIIQALSLAVTTCVLFIYVYGFCFLNVQLYITNFIDK